MQESIYGALMLTILCMGMLAGTMCFLFRDREFHVLYGIGLYGWFRFCKWTASRLYDRWWSE